MAFVITIESNDKITSDVYEKKSKSGLIKKQCNSIRVTEKINNGVIFNIL